MRVSPSALFVLLDLSALVAVGFIQWGRKWLSFVLFVFLTSFADSLGMQMDAHV